MVGLNLLVSTNRSHGCCFLGVFVCGCDKAGGASVDGMVEGILYPWLSSYVVYGRRRQVEKTPPFCRLLRSAKAAPYPSFDCTKIEKMGSALFSMASVHIPPWNRNRNNLSFIFHPHARCWP